MHFSHQFGQNQQTDGALEPLGRNTLGTGSCMNSDILVAEKMCRELLDGSKVEFT